MEQLIASLVGLLGNALVKGIQTLVSGGTLDDAIASSIEHLEDERAKGKFKDFRVG